MIHYGRNLICQQFDGDYLLFIDTDMCWVPEDIQKLVEADKDVAACFCYNRGFPYNPVIIPKSEEIFRQVYSEGTVPKEPFELLSSGAGFLLIKRKVLDTFFSQGIWPFDPIPLSTVDGEDKCGCGPSGEFPSVFYWEDHSFCYKARKLGFEIWCVPGASVGHLGASLQMETSPWEAWMNTVAAKFTGIEYQWDGQSEPQPQE